MLDSLLVVEQLSGRWKVKEPRLRVLRDEVLIRLSRFRAWTIRHEPRVMNRAADALANLALDDPAAADAVEAVRRPTLADRPLQAREFYSEGGLNIETYDARHEGIPGGDDVGFYVRAAREVGGPILELGVGTGRVALELAQAGFNVVGLDRSAAMLAIAEKKRERLSSPVAARLRWIEGDMAGFEAGDRFSLVIAPFRSFMSLTTPSGQRQALESVHRHLRPGGVLIVQLFDPLLELLAPGSHPGPARGSVSHPATGNEVAVRVVERVNDPLAQLLRERWHFTETERSGRVVREEEEILTLRWTYRYEMRYLLELAGFERLEEYSDFAGSPPAYGKEQVWVARRGSAKRDERLFEKG